MTAWWGDLATWATAAATAVAGIVAWQGWRRASKVDNARDLQVLKQQAMQLLPALAELRQSIVLHPEKRFIRFRLDVQPGFDQARGTIRHLESAVIPFTNADLRDVWPTLIELADGFAQQRDIWAQATTQELLADMSGKPWPSLDELYPGLPALKVAHMVLDWVDYIERYLNAVLWEKDLPPKPTKPTLPEVPPPPPSAEG